jgi:plastocyanin
MVAAVVVAATSVVALVRTRPASGATIYRVEVAHGLTSPAGAESRRFFPSRIWVHRGDTIRFTSATYVAVALLPAGQRPGTWLPAEWRGTARSWSPFLTDPDEASGHLVLNPRVAAQSNPTCGGLHQESCPFDGSGSAEDGVLGSGLPLTAPIDFSVSIAARNGAVLWALDLMDPAMRMRIAVVPKTKPASTQQGIDAQKAQLLADDRATAVALDERFRDKHAFVRRQGTVVWQAWAGIDAGAVSVARMYPARLTVRPGQSVEWHFDRLRHLAHTVTFPAGKAKSISGNAVAPVCDPGAGPDGGPEVAGPPYCDDPRDLELDVDPRLRVAAGNGAYAGGADFESSGVRGGGFATSTTTFPLRFPTPTASLFAFRCLLHPAMVGTVAVRP